ncbi:hypothetical protein D3C73_827200 [compost metagenome]
MDLYRDAVGAVREATGVDFMVADRQILQADQLAIPIDPDLAGRGHEDLDRGRRLAFIDGT